MHKLKNWRGTRKQKTLKLETYNTNNKVVKIYITQILGGFQWTFHAHKYYKYKEASKGIIILWHCFGDYSFGWTIASNGPQAVMDITQLELKTINFYK
jgi:hypothetical protein